MAITRRLSVLDEAKLLEPPPAPLDRGDQADVKERQLLQGETLPLRLVVADLAYEMVILHRDEEIELLLLEKAHGLIVIRLS
jgi:hypothetical protein